MEKLGYAIVFVSDMARSVRFYRDVLGLPLRFESPGWSEFATAGTTLALHRSSTPARDAGGADGEAAGSCRLGFQVADLDALHRALVAKEVPCTSPPAVRQYGVRQAVYRDPDGLSITLAEPPVRAP